MSATSKQPRAAQQGLSPALELLRGLGIVLDAEGLLGLVGAGLFPPVKLESGELLVSRSVFRHWSIVNGHAKDGAA